MCLAPLNSSIDAGFIPDVHEANKPSQTENDSNSKSRSKSAIENWLRKKLPNGLIDIDNDELNTYESNKPIKSSPTAIKYPHFFIIIHERWIHRARTPGPSYGRAAGLPGNRSDLLEPNPGEDRRLEPSWACLWPRAPHSCGKNPLELCL